MKPFMKWVGGKTQILDKVLSKFPQTRDIGDYHEPFVGGGSVLLGVLSNQSIKITGKVYASDLNPHLINLYKKVQTDPEDLLKNFDKIVEDYKKSPDKSEFYYDIRKRFNQEHLPEQFIFLNKAGFRGLYREGPNGFNVPFGHYKTPPTLDRDNLMKISALIKDVVFAVQDFKSSMGRFQIGDFVYLDPPYAPIDETSFVKYTEKGFTKDDHEKLFEMCKGTKFLLSNADVPYVRNHFVGDAYDIEVITCRRAINSRNPGSKVDKVLISWS